MGLLSEQVRRILKEESLIDVSSQYSTSSTNWATMHNYGSIVLSEDSIIAFRYNYGRITAAGSEKCNHRLKIGGVAVVGYPRADDGPDVVYGIFFLQAGTYSVVMEGIADYFDGSNYGKPYVNSFKLGKLSLSDTQGGNLAQYVTAITKNLTARTTCIGTVKNGTAAIIVCAYTPSAQTNMENVGESLTNDVNISVDGVQQNWTERKQDNITGSHNPVYGAALGWLRIVLSAGADHTISITKGNVDTVVNISLCFSPWILSADTAFEPVSLDFPQGSTLYVTLEPLSANPTKNINLGKKRAVSFGSATDYYSTASGTDILSWNYAFEIVEVNVLLTVDGWGGCVSYIGVDVR
jgi:hypothetical protein